ncbi:alpha/beta fold hydrolase [Shewanella sp. NFH-SH190041]|uniref:alpha/beta fold hydrolase n=1 Tax=Shewanella sp. NFH-SH190041 TaxID=2950245 RepID=UPI00396599A7
MMDHISQRSFWLPYRDGKLHLRCIAPLIASSAVTLPEGMSSSVHHSVPVLMLHGVMSNGRVFYSDSGRGLACFLARAGMTVYILDSAGRGQSTPSVAAGCMLGQGEVIREQLPQAHRFILSRHLDVKQVHWCAHSWGGVLMASALARFPELQSQTASLLTFGSKRTIRVQSLKKWLMVDVIWNRLAPWLTLRQGYLAADKWKIGMDSESRSALLQSIDWVQGRWIDGDDGFDYAAAARQCRWPRSWFIAGAADAVLGNPCDVRDMMQECGLADARYTLLSRQNGYRRNYGHGAMLTHPDAEQDHFPEVLAWYQNTDNKC